MEKKEEVYLDIQNLRTSIADGKKKYTVLDGIDIKVPKGKIIGIVGESGCGKSMVARSIMGLLKPPVHMEEGKIFFKDKDLLTLNAKELRAYKGSKISMIFQEPMTALNPVVKVGKQVREAILVHEKISKKEAKERVLDIFQKVGIPDPVKRYDAYPHELSGGLRQRVMIGMAMVCHPDVLIADEPTTALDVTVEAQILSLMKQLRDETDMSIVLITHNIGVVAELCDEVYVMYSGQIMEHAAVYELFEHAMHPYTKGLLASVPQLGMKTDRLPMIAGMVPRIDNRPSGCLFSNRCPYADEQCKACRPELTEAGVGHRVRCFQNK